MSVVNLNKITKYYGITEVLNDFSLFVNEGERIGLIGPNGSGKTTVFKIIAGMEPFVKGSLSIKRGAEIGYLSQMPDLTQGLSLFAELQTIYEELIQIEKRLRELEKVIAQKSNERALESNSDNISHYNFEELMEEYSNLQHDYEIKGGYQYESKIRQIAYGMGFEEQELINKQVENLSGGEKTRLGLVKLLLSEPDILLLDEPTNHLDLPSIQWLEDYLRDYKGTVIIISHDRYFLDQVIDRIVEIKNGKDEIYHGNYSYYLEERKRRYEQLKQAYENQQKKIQQMEEAIKRLHQWGRQGDNEKFFKRAKSMQKSLDKIERLDRPILDGKQIGLELSINKRSGNEVLHIEGLSRAFGDQEVLKGLDMDIYWQDKAALIGRNGTGKTTLIKILLGDLHADSGYGKIGANVKVGYYSQEFEGFKPEDDLITALRRECYMSTAEARNALAAFLFTEDEVFKKVGTLSGGEKSRLRLLQLMNGDYNFLILDEPTNHLDLPSREILEETIKNYPGTVLVVSHDRYFLNKIVNYIYELEDGRLQKYYGDYDYYKRKKQQFREQKNNDQKNVDRQTSEVSDYHKLKEEARQERKRQNLIDELEEKIEKHEIKIEELEAAMMNPEHLDDIELLNKYKRDYEKINKKLTELYNQWEEILGEG
ncbi:MAG: ribosomal protection-like ABC-F family protein [Halanaerobiales bacterium]